MSVVAIGLFLLGFAASWIAGRYVETGAALLQGGAVGACGVAALLIGMSDMVGSNLIWALIALAIYGLIAAVVFRGAQSARERAE